MTARKTIIKWRHKILSTAKATVLLLISIYIRLMAPTVASAVKPIY
jgi:hypothetical protein